jgi:hypothetical protein
VAQKYEQSIAYLGPCQLTSPNGKRSVVNGQGTKK